MARLPFDGEMRITSAYGMRTDPISGQRTRHGGLDIVGADYLIRAAVGGVVAVSQMVTVVAPAAIAALTVLARKAGSARVASSAKNSTSVQNALQAEIVAVMAACIASGFL